jgi:hypothetical protein
MKKELSVSLYQLGIKLMVHGKHRIKYLNYEKKSETKFQQ